MQIYNNSLYKLTLPLGLLGFSETIATISPTVETTFRVNNDLKLIDIN